MRNQRKSYSPFRTTQSIMRDSPNTQLDESSISTNRVPQNRESTRARMKINQSHNNALAQGGQIRKQIANERTSAKGGNPNEFNPKKFVTKDLKESDIIDIKQVFDYYDSEQAGILSPNDLEQLLTSCGYHPTKETLYEIFSELDEDELGGITFEYFLGILNQDKSKSERKDTIRRVYRKYDKNNKGFITLQDLRLVVYKDLKEEIDEEVLAEIFKKTDSNQDGKMTFEDFYNVMTKKVAYLIIMSCFINLTQRAKRTISIDFQNQGPLPKIQLTRSRAFSFNKNHLTKNSVTISPKMNAISPKIISKPVINDFHFFKLQNCQKASPLQELKPMKNTNKKAIKQKPSIDFSVSGFETTDIELEDFFLQSYVKKQ